MTDPGLRLPQPGSHGARTLRGPIAQGFTAVRGGVFRLTGGVVPPQAMLLWTVGAVSGRSRTAIVRRFGDGPDRWLIVASAGGSARHPGWAHNVARHPDRVSIQVGRRRFAVRPTLLEGSERTAAWQRIVAAAPQFERYQRRTDRELPVFRLTQRG